MKNQFQITGLFYEHQSYKFRKYLNIKLKVSQKKVPDLMVIMMNPGSSKPLDENTTNSETETKPDNTQDQIMRIMLKSGFEFSRILNLSDLREGKSKNFFPKILEMEQKEIKHSIFDENRIKDFESLFISGVPVFYAWGVNDRLKVLAMKAMERIGKIVPIGFKSEGDDWGYYHPLPPSSIKQEKWVKNVLTVIKDKKVIVEKTTI
jgi:hypothetical protein